jgi:1,4-dihydroxy-2-naphthoate octaprenyltransferase
MKTFNAWIAALRLRTLPLALASTGMGNLLALTTDKFDPNVCALTLLTSVFLQILSNLANDYGDMVKGADNETRVGPVRGLQSGLITPTAMIVAIIITSFISLNLGCILISVGTKDLQYPVVLLFLALGLLSIVAAIRYTVGKKPYGYAGWGDFSVFFFFGLVGVAGTYYLQVHNLEYYILLPASAIGFLCVGVLNINNMRDIESDTQAGKRTLVVRMGLIRAKIYHFFLIITAFICLTIFTLLRWNSPWQWLYLITLPLFIVHLVYVAKSNSAGMDKYLKQLAISTLFLVCFFGIGIFLNPHV